MYTPVNHRFTNQKRGVRGSTLYRLVSMMVEVSVNVNLLITAKFQRGKIFDYFFLHKFNEYCKNNNK